MFLKSPFWNVYKRSTGLWGRRQINIFCVCFVEQLIIHDENLWQALLISIVRTENGRQLNLNIFSLALVIIIAFLSYLSLQEHKQQTRGIKIWKFILSAFMFFIW